MKNQMDNDMPTGIAEHLIGFILNILHDPKYLLVLELSSYYLLGSCRIFRRIFRISKRATVMDFKPRV